MYKLFIIIFCFIIFNYNILSIWFSFFLDLSCYLSPFFWDSEFFFFLYENKFTFLFNFYNNNYFENFYVPLYKNLFFFPKQNNQIDYFIYYFDMNINHFNNQLIKHYLLLLEATVSRINLVDFFCLQDKQIILAGETSLSFYRIYNKSFKDILFYSVYVINPSVLSLYLIKVQCFCFEEILVNSGELINLPILLYLDHTILLENNLNWINIIFLEYIALIKEV
jgi:cytochrome c oxidase assembly protein Cox11